MIIEQTSGGSEALLSSFSSLFVWRWRDYLTNTCRTRRTEGDQGWMSKYLRRTGCVGRQMSPFPPRSQPRLWCSGGAGPQSHLSGPCQPAWLVAMPATAGYAGCLVRRALWRLSFILNKRWRRVLSLFNDFYFYWMSSLLCQTERDRASQASLHCRVRPGLSCDAITNSELSLFWPALAVFPDDNWCESHTSPDHFQHQLCLLINLPSCPPVRSPPPDTWCGGRQRQRRWSFYAVSWELR